MKKPQLIGLLILSLLATGGALAQSVTLEFDRDTDFTKYKTLAIRNGELNGRNPALNRDLGTKQMEGDIVRDLTARGLTETSDRADLKLVYRFGSHERRGLRRIQHEVTGFARAVRVPFAEGTLVVDLRGPLPRALVRRAIAREEKNDATKIAGQLDDLVKKPCEKYLPKK
jgi:hypothetical protein